MVAEEAAEDEDGEGAEDEDNGVGVSSTEQEAKSQGEEAGRDEKEDEGLIKKRKHWTRARHICTQLQRIKCQLYLDMVTIRHLGRIVLYLVTIRHLGRLSSLVDSNFSNGFLLKY